MPMVNRDLGPCVVIWDESGANVDFDKTFGGVFFRYEEMRVGVLEDQQGVTEVDEMTTGATNPELTVPLTREHINKLSACFLNSELGADYLRVNNPVGQAQLAHARQVIVKPIENGVVSTNSDEWLYIHRAVPRVAMEQPYDVAGQRVVNVLFKGFPDNISGRQNALWDYGDGS